jgi:hypothetical protein
MALIELEASDTLTVATGAWVTVTVALPDFPSLVAVMLAVPTAIPATTPDALTVATAGLLELQVIDRPVRIFPLASFVVAVACVVPTAVIELAARPTVTVATGAVVTVIEDVPVFPSLVAVIVVLPAPAAVTSPLASTVAAALLEELQVMVRPLRMLLFASLVTAVNCCVGEMPSTRAADPGFTVTVATGADVTVSNELSVLPSAVATMLAVPVLTAVTSPVEGDTVATAVLSELQLMVRPDRTRPLESKSVAVACAVCTAVIELGVNETVTVATGAGVTVMAALPVFPSLVAMMFATPTATPVTTP